MNATVRYLTSLEQMQAAAVNEIIAEGFGEPQPSEAQERRITFRNLEGPRKRMKPHITTRRVKIGSHAQTALTPKQRKSRAKTNRRNKRKANGGLTVKDAREVEAFKKFLRSRQSGQITPLARAYGQGQASAEVYLADEGRKL